MRLNRLASFPLREIVSGLLAGQAGRSFRIREDGPWCYVTPVDHRSRVQGWKLHVSATWLAAPMVLHQAAQVLLEHGCAFKFAGTLEYARQLCHKDTERAQAGKFITAYPRDDEQFRELALLLDRATAGLPGPTILSDRPVRPGSLVHYRYGVFTGIPVLTNDGVFERRLEAPDGTLVSDVREPWFCPPEWAELPFEGPPGRAAVASPRPVRLAGRFQVSEAIRHSARGGVYRGIDRRTGELVVIKHARAHISGLSLGGDARDGLRHESAMLAQLGALAPREVALVEEGPHTYLVMEALAGETLGVRFLRWWRELADLDSEVEGPPVDEVSAVAGALAEVVDAVHARGLVFRDLSPNNVIVLGDGSLRLVDAELVTRPGEWVLYAYTPGFAPPELMGGPAFGPAPGSEADWYALGALLCQLVTGTPPPALPASGTDEGTADLSGGGRLAVLLRHASVRGPAARRMAVAILGLTAADPRRRWTPDRLRDFLAAPDPTAAPARTDRLEGAKEEREPSARRRTRNGRLIRDGLAHLVAALPEDASERLVPTDDFGRQCDPCSVQHGAAGVLATLVRASSLPGGEELRAVVGRVAGWIDRRRTTVSPLLPGLYFGRSGTAWALHDAARQLDDDGLAERALELAESLPVRWPNPDVTHGTAGAGLASLHLWYETKEPAMLDRVHIAVDHLGEHASHAEDGRIHWQVATDFDSRLAGISHLGFAHGVSGIAAFLLAAARATGRDDALRLARQAGDTLAATVVRGDGLPYWPNNLSGPDVADLRYHWCSGASGVGTFLVRLWRETGQARYRALAHEAAVTVRRARWLGGVSQCHGMAGNGEFLLDLAEATGEERYRDWAEELATCLYLRARTCNGRLVVSDDRDGPLNLDFNTGTAGVVGYLLRLRHGGPRLWMVDAPYPDAA